MFFITFCILMMFWVLLSGRFDAFHLGMGVVSSAFIAYFSHDFLFVDQKRSLWSRFTELLRFLRYVPWLFWEIAKANWHVFKLTLHPHMMRIIDPHIIRFNTSLESDFAKFIFATSITLTPGTITVQVNGSEFVVYALDKELAESLPGEMERRIARVYYPDAK